MDEATSSDPTRVHATITTNRGGWLQVVSPNFLELTGRPVDKLGGVNLGDLIHPEDVTAVRAALAQAAGENDADSVNVRLFVAGDRWLPMQVSVQLLDQDRLGIELLESASTVQGATPPLAQFLAGQPPVAVRSGTPTNAAPTDPARRAYLERLPGDEVRGQRVAARDAVGEPTTPVIEIDANGQTVFVSGDWSALSASHAAGADVFEELLERSDRADQILDAMARVFATAEPSNYELAVPGLPPRWARLTPIPSPHRAGVVNALIAIVPESRLASRTTAVGASNGDEAASTAPVGAVDIDNIDPSPRSTSAKWTRGLVWVLVAALAVVALVNLIGGSGDDPEPIEPITTDLVTTQATQVNDAQVWRQVGASSLGEIYGIAATDDGAVVADLRGRIIRLDRDGASVGASGLTADVNTFVSDLAHAGSGTVWVLDAGLGQISQVSANGTVTTLEAGSGPLRNARGLGVGSNDTMWVASTAAAQLTQLSLDGSLVGTIELPGRQPSDVVELDDGTLWVVDAQDLELIHVDNNGTLLSTIPLDSFSSVQSPHLAMADGQLWVTEPDGSAVFSVDLATDQVTSERIQINRPDGSSVVRPIGIDVGPDGRFWIVDSQGAGIVILDR